MKQSRLEKFFTTAASSISKSRLTTTNEHDHSTIVSRSNAKRSSTTNEVNIKKFKGQSHDVNNETNTDNPDVHSTLNQFYLTEFLRIRSSMLTHHTDLLNDNERTLLNIFSTLSGRYFVLFCFVFIYVACSMSRHSSIANDIHSFIDASLSMASSIGNKLWFRRSNRSSNSPCTVRPFTRQYVRCHCWLLFRWATVHV
jgi:hypothetical protein